MPLKLEPHPEGLIIAAKVVPNSRRAALVGLLGDALKIKVVQPPEQGKANEAVIALLAQALHIAPQRISVIAGQSQPHKKILIRGLDAPTINAVLLPSSEPHVYGSGSASK